jgi:hypothetical protein
MRRISLGRSRKHKGVDGDRGMTESARLGELLMDLTNSELPNAMLVLGGYKV